VAALARVREPGMGVQRIAAKLHVVHPVRLEAPCARARLWLRW
jgi:hypothetical protein